MPNRDEFIAEVDALLIARKTLGGIGVPGRWQPGWDGVWQRLKLPLEVDGVSLGHQALDIEFDPTSSHLVFTINLLCHVCVCRMDFDYTDTHPNTLRNPVDGVLPIIIGSHFHRWSYNRRFAESSDRLISLNNAEHLPIAIKSFDSALRWFCDETNIELPHDHWISLPERTLV